MARIIEETIADKTGKEAGLTVTARIFLVAGIVFMLAGIAVMIIRGEFAWLAYGAVCMVLGIVVFMIFSALAEIIILLKKLCGLPFSGVIPGTKTGTVFVCSECGSMTWPDSEKCDKCGAVFEPAEPTRSKDPETDSTGGGL